MNNNLFKEKCEEEKKLDDRVTFFKNVRETCLKKIEYDPTEKPKSFFKILSEIEKKYSEAQGACEVLLEFYNGAEIDDTVLMEAAELINML